MMQEANFNMVYQFVHSPSKVAIAIVNAPGEIYNPITIEWFMRTSIKPPMIAISIGLERYSYECLQNSDYFNLCIPAAEMLDETMFCGTVSGRQIHKLEEVGLAWFPGKLQRMPIISEAAANFECEIVTQVKTGDHVIFVGEVKYAWLNDKKKMLLL